MVMTGIATSARYAVNYVGNPTTDATTMKALVEDGPLLLAKEHSLVQLLPDALTEDTATGMMNFSQADYQSLVVGGAIFDSDVGNGGTHFAVRGSRLTLRRLGGHEWPNSCQGDPLRLPPDGSSIYDYGPEASMGTPRQDGWDWRSCHGSRAVGRRRSVSSASDERDGDA